MGQGQNEVFGEGVPDAEGQFAVVVFAKDGVAGKVRQRVVHPAHVPLHAEPQAPEIGWARDHGPGGGFLGNGFGVGKAGVGHFI